MKKILILILLTPSLVWGAENTTKEFDDSVMINGVEYANINTIVEASRAKITKEIARGIKKTAIGISFMCCVLKPLAEQASEIVKAIAIHTVVETPQSPKTN